jgi:hypothetical protein
MGRATVLEVAECVHGGALVPLPVLAAVGLAAVFNRSGVMSAVARLVGFEAVIDVEAVAEVGVGVVFDEDGGLAGLNLNGGAIEAVAGGDEEFRAILEARALDGIGDLNDDLQRTFFHETDGHSGRVPDGFQGIRAGGRPGSVAVEDTLDGRQGGVAEACDTHAGQAVDDLVPSREFSDAHSVGEAPRRPSSA